MNIATIANAIMPLSAALTCFLVISLYLYYDRYNNQNFPVKTLWYYYLCCIVNWGSIFVYFYWPSIFVGLNPVVMFSFIMAQVLFYKFLFLITKIDSKERFSPLHLFIPAFIVLLLLGLMLVTPFEYQLMSVLGKGEFTGGSYIFFVVSNSKMPVRLVYSIIYTTLSFVRLYRYRQQVVNVSANFDKSWLSWVKTLLVLSLSLIPIPLMGVLLPRDVAAASPLLSVQNLIIVFQYSFLCYHTIKHNYVFLMRVHLIKLRPWLRMMKPA